MRMAKPLYRAVVVALLAGLPGTGCAQDRQVPADDYEAAREKMDEYRRQAPSKKPFERAPEDEALPDGQVNVPAPDDLLAAIVEDAARRGGVDPTLVQVVSSQRTDWPDGGLGCPEPGREYIQVVVPGYQVLVSVAGRLLDYRSDLAGHFFVCGPERLRRPGPEQ